MSDGPCCWLELCCPPREAAGSIVRHLGVVGDETPYGVVLQLISKFRLVPRAVEPITEGGDPVPVSPRNERLASLLRHIDTELPLILQEQGHAIA